MQKQITLLRTETNDYYVLQCQTSRTLITEEIIDS